MISRLTVKAAIVGIAASVAVAAPASAATKPTLDAQSKVVLGFSIVQLTGTAEPGATVQLYESAFVFKDIQPAKDYDNNNGPVTAVANAQGRFTINRYMDSGFLFQVRASGETSNTETFEITQQPSVDNLRSPSNNTVTVDILASPGQPHLDAQLQKRIGSTWTTIGRANTSEGDANGVGGGKASITATNVSGGLGLFRAYVGGDPANAVLPGPSANNFQLQVGGAETDPPTTNPTSSPTPTPTNTTSPKPTTPSPTPTTPKPTTPSPTPTTPKPTTPAPVLPAIGSVQFTRIQFDSPGTDSGSNGSLNTEWAKLTNKSKASINLNGWTVRDSGNHVYKFIGNVVLKPGASVFVLSGKGKNTATHKYWGRAGKAGYIWNNDREVGYIRTPTGRQIDTCIWYTRGTGYTNC